jgi:CRISPR-associated protein Csb1
MIGSRFQPTGFPDIGAAVFDRPTRGEDGRIGKPERALLVESAQSMANHLEAVSWDRAAQQPVPELAGLPYVRVIAQDDGRYLTSSRTEAHRLASAFVKDSTLDGTDMKTVIRERLGLRDDSPLAPREIARAVFTLDPLCLIHGVFFAESAKVWPGQPRITRALSGCIEAADVQEVVSGGVKRDEVRHRIGDTGGAAEGYGFVPFHRTEFTAGRITASFSLDLQQIDAYGLPAPARDLLVAIARWEIRALLDGGLRLRTACDLRLTTDEVVDRAGQALPSYDELTADVRRSTEASAEWLGSREPLEVVWQGGSKRSKK